jgi:predicted adenine nucleotide alpha hydrolase (AANH) superfamily ATPase
MDYERRLDEIMANSGDGARVLLHSCCAVCSSRALERLSGKFSVTVLYYNPNIYPREEYEKRKSEQLRLIREAAYPRAVDCLAPDYDHGEFLSISAGLESLPEGSERCERCFELRLRKAARTAAEGGYDFFATTLTVSPHKNAATINGVGEALARESGVGWLCADFKKRDGYLRATRLAELYGLYRQNYCGCEFSVKKQ